VHVDDQAPPKVFAALHQWAVGLRDLGEVSSALSAAHALCREAVSHDQYTQAYRLLAELHAQAGDRAAAMQVRERLVELARVAAEAEPSTDRMFDLLTALDDLGDLARQQGDHWIVLECYGNHGRMAILRHLVELHGLRPSLLTEQCYSLRRAGAAARELGAHEEARSLLEERLTVARLTFAGDPSDRRLIPLVAAALNDLGSLHARRGDPRAGALLSEELCLRQWLQTSQPDDVGARQDLANCHLTITTTGPDTGQHLLIATTLLSQMEAEGALDIPGRLLLSGLRNRDQPG
jgi:tetratricopeptide (TPR) repeat protein